MAGFSGRPEPFVKVSSTLEANAVAFRDDNGRCSVLVTLDTLYVGEALHTDLICHFVSKHGQNAADLLVLGSHTHFAPSLDATKPVLGPVDPAYLSMVKERCRLLVDRVVTESGRPVFTERRTGSSLAAINRRRRWPVPHFYRRRLVHPQTVMAPNPSGPFDPTITAIAIIGVSGDPIALLWHYACHPTAFPHPLHVSAEFPGVVRSRLRERYGDALPVLFLQGFAGDIRSRVPETRPLSRRAFDCLFSGPSFDSFTSDGWQRWSESLASDVLGAFKGDRRMSRNARDEPTAIGSAHGSAPLDRLLTGDQGGKAVLLQRVRLSADIDIVAVAAEPLTGLRTLVPFEDSLAVGYLGDVFGYWPTDRDIPEGGYEVNHFIEPFGLRGRFHRPLDAIFRSAVDELRLLR
ncbi:MAG: hypothetical protein KIT25_10055 [Enhydrobacter sp.]|nr:MAG: hypothetical protein KIT25_10055 [Enhydrobacter sp.]